MWTYKQSTGELLNPDSSRVATGYAGGNCGKNPEGVNNCSMETVHNIGPLPCGKYTFGTPVAHSQLGVFAIPLIPDPMNVMYGRGGFFCHGDTESMTQSASEGCIIMPRNIRNMMAESDDHQLQVIP